MYYNNKSIAIDNDRFKQEESLRATYDQEKLTIENSILDETAKAEKLKKLDEKYNRDKQKMDADFEKQKRQVQRKAAETSKKIAIFETLIAIPQAAFQAFKALSGISVVGPILGFGAAAAVTGFGIAKLQMIKDQPLPEATTGGVFNAPYIGGEAGAEMAVPLEGANGQNAIKSFASGLLDVMSQKIETRATVDRNTQTQAGGGDVYLDGTLVGRWISKASNNVFHSFRELILIYFFLKYKAGACRPRLIFLHLRLPACRLHQSKPITLRPLS